MFCYKQQEPGLANLRPKEICGDDVVRAQRTVRTDNQASGTDTWELLQALLGFSLWYFPRMTTPPTLPAGAADSRWGWGQESDWQLSHMAKVGGTGIGGGLLAEKRRGVGHTERVAPVPHNRSLILSEILHF